jgi:phosphocarrier protein
MERGTRRINAKSIMGVMMLAAGKGSTVTIDTEGDRADEALQAILALIGNRFGEDE